MTWTLDSTTQNWSKTGTDREALIADADLGASAAITLQLIDSAKPVLVVLMASQDGRTCYEVGIVSTNLVIRQTIHAVAGSSLATAAHGLTSGDTYTLEVQRRGKVITGTITKADGTTVSVTYTNLTVDPDEEVFDWQDSWGFVSSSDGAVVAHARTCGLKPESSERKDVTVFIAGGSVGLLKDGALRTLESGVFDPEGDVWAFVYRQKVYAGDGRVARVIDPNDDADPIVPWSPTAGYLPGQTTAADVAAGVCTATCGTVYFDRPVLAGAPHDPQNLFGSKIGDPLDWDTAADVIDRAYGASTDRSRVGQPVVALAQSATGLLVIGCRDSIWQMSGDPAIGIPEIIEIDHDSGVSHANALKKVRDGLVLAHSPTGLLLVSPGTVSPLSELVLTEGIQIPREDIDDYLVSVGRDSERYLTWVFLTKRATGASVHFAYSERVGRFIPGDGGIHPQQFSNNIGPTAVGMVDGKLVLGGRDGYMRVLDDSAKDDDGAEITLKIPVLFVEGSTQHDTIINKLKLSLGKNSDDARVRVYGGIDAERVYDTAERWTLLNTTVPSGRMRSIDRGLRAPALLAEISGTGTGTSVSIEVLEAETRLGRLSTKKARSPFTLETLCPPPTAAGSGSGGGSFGSGPGDGGSDTPTSSCGTITVTVGATPYDFGEDSVVTGVLYGRCRDAATSTGDGTLNNGWGTTSSNAFAFADPVDNAGACKWSFTDGAGTSWVQFNTDGTWTYSIAVAHQAYYTCADCSLEGEGYCDYTTSDTGSGSGLEDGMLVRDNATAAHPTCADFSSSNCDIGLFGDFDLDNGCAPAPTDDATGFRHYLAYVAAA